MGIHFYSSVVALSGEERHILIDDELLVIACIL